MESRKDFLYEKWKWQMDWEAGIFFFMEEKYDRIF